LFPVTVGAASLCILLSLTEVLCTLIVSVDIVSERTDEAKSCQQNEYEEYYEKQKYKLE